MVKISAFLILSIMMFFLPFDKVQKKILRSNQYDIECFVLIKNKKITLNVSKTYFWFKGGEIHSSQSSFGGNLLHKNFSKFFRSNQLAEKGTFEYGLKDGLWKNWFENGNLKQQIRWRNGIKNGDFISYNEDGSVYQRGLYKNNLKSGKWIDEIAKDTLNYEKGKVIAISKHKQSEKKKSLFKFLKRNKTNNAKKIKSKSNKKEGFLKRLFSRKKRSNKSLEKH